MMHPTLTQAMNRTKRPSYRATRRAKTPVACTKQLSPLAQDLGELRRYLAAVKASDVTAHLTLAAFGGVAL